MNGLPDLFDGRTKTTEITQGLQTVHRSTARAAKAAKINSVWTTGKIGNNKTVPPQTGVAMWTTTRLLPGEKPSMPCNILDVNRNKKYQ